MPPVVFNRLFLITLVVLTGYTSTAALHANEMAAPSNQPVFPQTYFTAEPAATTATPAARATPTDTTAATPLTFSADTALAQTDVWQRIRNGFAMRELDSPLVQRNRQWYAGKPEYMARMTGRAQRYLYFIVEEVERRGMPMEIALLPIIESAFHPGAYSVASASGIWQFIPSTGKNFGMDQNWWYDGRRDIVSATHGALDYLQKLHGMFGDWELALAAYNWGEGAVQRAQARNRKLGLPVNYASLKLPPETRNYVPKLLAVKHIISDPASFGLVLQPIANQPYFAPVITARHIDVKLAAELAEITLDEFMALNPAHNRPVILQEHAEVLLLPVAKVETFRANLERYSAPLVSWQAYRSKKGERLDQLASRFGLSLAALRTTNSLPARAKLSTGQALLVPIPSNGNGELAENKFEPFNTHLAPSATLLKNAVRNAVRTVRHTVRKGDTLSSIARRYQVRLASLQSWNKGVKTLRLGQRIYVAQPGKPHLAKATKGKKQFARKVQRVAYKR